MLLWIYGGFLQLTLTKCWMFKGVFTKHESQHNHSLFRQASTSYTLHKTWNDVAVGGCWLSPTALLSNYDRYPPFRHTERLSDTTAASNAPFLPCGPDIGLERTKLNGYFLHSLQYHGRFAGSRHVFDLMTSNLARMGFLTWATRGRHRIKDSSSCLTNRSIQR